VSAEEVDDYRAAIEEPKRGTLQALRCTIREIVPEAEEAISYRVPAFRLGGQTIAGFAAFKNHLSYLPFSGSVLPQLADELKGYAKHNRQNKRPPETPKTAVSSARLSGAFPLGPGAYASDQQESPFLRAFGSPLTDSNRRPPPYHQFSDRCEGLPIRLFSPYLNVPDLRPFATGCAR
jgi:uncharacterized protein YdhG (YjbR/CyaY superfamily)